MTLKLLAEICSLFAVLFVLGSLACLPLFGMSVRRFLVSRLWQKVYWWLPIFGLFIALLYIGAPLALLLYAGLLAQAAREYYRQQAWYSGLATMYLASFSVALWHLVLITAWLPSAVIISGLTAICFASVLSDVGAFFMGSYTGRHHLPPIINAGKSWEGVAGQIIGAVAGLAIAALLPNINFSLPFALLIGCASAFGDLINSMVKRQLAIKDWSQFIPGHGGVLDRFSSLSFALAAGFWLLH